MDKIIVYLDDAAYARAQLAAHPAGEPVARPTHWILVACAPRMTHRVSKWVSHTARENWRGKWADRLFEQVVPPLEAAGDQVTTVLARGPLPELTRQLADEHGQTRVIDVRRPKSGPAEGPQPGAAGMPRMLATLLGSSALALAFD
jgi:hypothetical protein